MALLLTREETQPLLDLGKAIDLTVAAHREQAAGKVTAHAPYHVHVSGQQALRVVSGALIESRRMGIRLGPNSQLSGESMIALLYDTESGSLLSVMGYPFGTLRTAAAVALAARYLARADSKTAGLFGSGRNALGLVKGIASLCRLEKIVVSSRDAERRKSFCKESAQELQLEVVSADRPEQAVRTMDIILTATNSPSPVFPAEWLEPGMHVSSMGKPTELSQAAYLKADRVVIGCREHERNYWDRACAHPLVELDADGRLPWDRVPEMGELVAGRAPGRQSAAEITVFKESQGGFGDVAFAAWIYQEARRRGLGREINL